MRTGCGGARRGMSANQQGGAHRSRDGAAHVGDGRRARGDAALAEARDEGAGQTTIKRL